jgi:hypothetical protein
VTVNRRPRASTTTLLLLPTIFFPGSMPCVAVGTVCAVLTLWASMAQAGARVCARPARARCGAAAPRGARVRRCPSMP